jgi:DNA-binding MarR family transcriptional regulator
MSRGLGETQLRMLELLATRELGFTVREMSTVLALTPRHCRAVVDSLEERGLIVPTMQRGAGRRWWLPEHHERQARWAEFDRAANEFFAAERERRHPEPTMIRCPLCGHVSEWR